MIRRIRFDWFTVAVGALAVLASATSPALAQPCVIPDNGTGTVDLPPAGCPYLSPSDVHLIIDGLPAGTQLNLDPSHDEFFLRANGPGGSLGGEFEQFDSILFLQVTGVGPPVDLFNRFLSVPVTAVTHTGPRNPGDVIQDFDTDMFLLQGELFGDPDFCTFRVTGGTSNGLPSPGHTTLTRLPSGNFNVDSFFDITYQIEFQGCPGSILDGFDGTTTGTLRMESGQPAPPRPPCTVADNGNGTVDLPPPGCGYVSPDELHMMIDGLPAGTEINIAPEHAQFFNVSTSPGGNLGGEVETFQSNLQLQMVGQGPPLDGFARSVNVPIQCETHTGPRVNGDPVQEFPTEMVQLQGELFGDPDFCTFRVRGGSGLGLPPSPGSTVLTQLPSGDFNVDSFFDITYQIEFQGCPGSILDGMGGTTTGTVSMQTGVPHECPAIPAGTDVFPSTGKLVLQLLGSPDPPVVLRLSDVGHGPTVIARQEEDTATRTVQTEMLSMSLSGNHPSLGGPVNVVVGSSFNLPASTGELRDIQKNPDDCTFVSADSFFDVFTEISLSTGQVLRNQEPLRLERRLHSFPPKDEPYENPFVPNPPILLFDINTNQPVAEVYYERHHADPPFPPPGEDCFDTFLDAQVDYGLGPVPVQLQGPTTVTRGPTFPAPTTCCTSGAPCQTDADCGFPDVCLCGGGQGVQTELLEMDLVGLDPINPQNEIRLRVSQDQPSPGQMVSQLPDQTYPANASFDVFFEVEVRDTSGPPTDPPIVQASSAGPLRVSNLGSSGKDGVRNTPPDPNSDFRSDPGVGVALVGGDGTPIGGVSDVGHIIGPPYDWQPPPPPGDDCFDSWLHLEITIFNPFCTEVLWIPSVFRVLRDAPADPGGIGQEIIETLMAKGLLPIDSQCLGALTGTLSPDVESGGEVASLAPAEFFPADSFFDVNIVLDSGIGPLTAGPLHMETTVNSLPPEEGEIYFGPGTVIPLLDDGGSQIGEILELEHEVHAAVDCPIDCLPHIEFGVAQTDALDQLQGGPPDPKAHIEIGVISASAGLLYDLVRGDLGNLHATSGGMGSAVCLQDNGSSLYIDTDVPSLGDGYFYLARDGWKAFVGSWNTPFAPPRVGNRDTKVSACTP